MPIEPVLETGERRHAQDAVDAEPDGDVRRPELDVDVACAFANREVQQLTHQHVRPTGLAIV